MGYDLDTYFIEKPHHTSPRRLYSQTGAYQSPSPIQPDRCRLAVPR
jgi:hypothetical protein